MRKTFCSTLALTLLLGMAGLGRGDDSAKPYAVISLSSYDRINGDLDVIGKAIGNPTLPKALEGFIAATTQQKGLVGLDKARPWGAVFAGASQDQPAYFFLPVTDLKGLLDALQGPLGGPAKQGSDGVYEAQSPSGPVFAKQKGSWVFAAHSAEGLKSTPDDPLPLLGELPKKYSVAAKVTVGNIPPALREMLLSRFKAGAAAAKMEGDESFSPNKLAEKVSVALTTALDELDEMTLGLVVDATAQKTSLELTFVAKDGTKLAKQVAENTDLKTNYAAFHLADAALALSWVKKLPAEAIAENLAALKAFRERLPAQLEKQKVPEMKQAVDELLDVVAETLKGGRSDGNVSAVLDPKAVSLVGAINIVGGDKLDTALHELAAVAKAKEPDVAKAIKLDVEKAAGVRFHLISLPIVENRERIVPMVGETLDVALGIADGALYVAAGRDALATLKKTIEKSAADGPKAAAPGSFSLALGSLAKFLVEVAPDEARPMAMMLSTLLSQSAGKDHLSITGTMIPRGTQVRLELEDGVLKAFVTIGQMGAMMGGGRGAGF